MINNKRFVYISFYYYFLSSALRSGMMDSLPEQQRLASLVDDDIEVVSAEQDFMRYSLEFLLKAIIMGMVRVAILIYSCE